MGPEFALSAPRGAPANIPEVVIDAKGRCAIPAGKLEGIRSRTRQILRDAYTAGFSHLPIDRENLFSRTVSLIDEDSICRALTTPSGADEENHNDLRREYRGSALSVSEAESRGFYALSVPLEVSCPANYGWKDSFFYTGVDECKDVTDEFPEAGLPTFIYSAQMPAGTAAEYLRDVGSMNFYTRYAGEGPVRCHSGPNYDDAYHEIWVSPIWPNLKFVMRGIHGRNFAAWKILRSCKNGEKTFEAGDLMFVFGVRVFIPLDVEDGDRRSERAFIVMQTAAASGSPLRALLSAKFRFESGVGREFAKKLFLEAKAKGWRMEK